MSNLDKYNEAFVEVFGVEASALSDAFSKDTVSSWDSVHQLGIMTLLEDNFDVMFDPEDIMELTSYAAGKEILKKYGVEI